MSHTIYRRWFAACVYGSFRLTLLALLGSSTCYADQSGSGAKALPENPDEVDIVQGYASRTVNEAAQWFDSFFDDPNYRAEDASTRIRVRAEGFFQQKDDAKYKLKLNAKIHLPKLAEKADRNVSLVLGGNDELEGDEGEGSLNSAFSEAYDDPAIGLQFFGLDTKAWNVSLTTGVKVSGPSLFIGPRVRYQKSFTKKTLFRGTQTIRWFTDDKWDLRTRLDLDHNLSNTWFFRQTLDVRWREEKKDEDGVRTIAATSFTQWLKDKSAINYQWTNVFKTKPHSRMESTAISVQYRQRFWKKWLFYEVIPQLAFQNEHDWEANPGITLRLEAIIGRLSKKVKSEEMRSQELDNKLQPGETNTQ